MAEHIDRLDASTIPVLPAEQRVPFKTVEEAFEEGWRQALEMVAMMEPADVVERKTAKWRYQVLTVPGGKGQTYAKWSCSRCRKKEKKRSPYCPNCGAEMDGDL